MKARTKLVLLGMVVIAIIFAAVGCSSTGKAEGTGTQTSPVKQTERGKIAPAWVAAVISGDAVSVSLGEVDSAGMAHFKVPVDGRNLTFMAHTIDGSLQVRANVCVPCRSTSFSLDGDKLVCNSCGTVFSATSGKGVSGPCRDYPKASVTYQVNGDSIIMQMNDLQIAYDDTIKLG